MQRFSAVGVAPEAERLDSHVLQKPAHTIEHRNAEFQACS